MFSTIKYKYILPKSKMKTNNIIIIISSIVVALLGLILYAYKRYKPKLPDEPKPKFTTNSRVISTNKITSIHAGGRHIKNRKKPKKKY